MSHRKALINISNIHSGGALQVAVSFVSELLVFENVDARIKVLISDEVAFSVGQERISNSSWDIEVFNTYGFRTIWSDLGAIQKRYDVVFTLFGPKYTVFLSSIEVVGFAQAWILEFDNPISITMPKFAQFWLLTKYSLQKWFFQRADHLVVELEHVRQKLSDIGAFDRDRISVVHNTFSNLYLNPHVWQDLPLHRCKEEIAIGFVTRDYPHKNIGILPDVAKIIRDKYRLSVRFYLSLTDSEWDKYSKKFGDLGVSVGSLSVYQCPTFYKSMDAVVFPSLLECFSATPLEALVMRKPLFASDRGFVRDVCGDYAIYFDPLDASNIAEAIAGYFLGPQKTNYELEEARNHVLSFSNATQRAKDYLRIVQRYLDC